MSNIKGCPLQALLVSIFSTQKPAPWFINVEPASNHFFIYLMMEQPRRGSHWIPVINWQCGLVA
jgi:hypothetical protein